MNIPFFFGWWGDLGPWLLGVAFFGVYLIVRSRYSERQADTLASGLTILAIPFLVLIGAVLWVLGVRIP